VSILQGNDKSPKTALTFNVSWGNEVIYDILSTLKKENIRATFFVSGEWTERHQHIIELMQEDNHELAFNGNRYTNYLNDDVEEMKRDIVSGLEILKKYDITPTYIRKPNGIFDEEMQTYLKQFPLQAVYYSLHTNDTNASSASSIHKEVVKNINNGDIILMHGTDSAIYTVEALQKIITDLKKNNMQILTLTELLQEIDIEEKSLD